jgi:phosphoribosyl 1,2-cyclic phosphate phosphodiesterase
VVGSFSIGAVTVTPVPVRHGEEDILGFLFKCGGQSLGYVPDCSAMPQASIDILKGVDVMVLDALRIKPHKTHLSLEQSLGILERIGPGKAFLTHMCHDLDHEETEKNLPPGVKMSCDGLIVEW